MELCTELFYAIIPTLLSWFFLAKNIGISYQQYYKMCIVNQNLTFLWENWP